MKFNITRISKASCMLSMLILASITCSGCNLGRYASKTLGDDSVEALYKPAHRPLVVIVKDEPDPSGQRVESEEIAAEIEDEFTTHKVAPIVSSQRVIEYRSDHPVEYATMSPAKIGKAVGADQVLYVQISESERDTQATTDMMRGRISAFVSIIDAHNGQTLWPTDGSGSAAAEFSTPLYRLGDKNNPQSIDRLLHTGLAKKISQQFYSFTPDD